MIVFKTYWNLRLWLIFIHRYEPPHYNNSYCSTSSRWNCPFYCLICNCSRASGNIRCFLSACYGLSLWEYNLLLGFAMRYLYFVICYWGDDHIYVIYFNIMFFHLLFHMSSNIRVPTFIYGVMRLLVKSNSYFIWAVSSKMPL